MSFALVRIPMEDCFVERGMGRPGREYTKQFTSSHGYGTTHVYEAWLNARQPAGMSPLVCEVLVPRYDANAR